MEIVLAGRYLLNTSRIGSGAFGQIYQGKQPHNYYRLGKCLRTGDKVAIKMVRNGIINNICRKKIIHKRVCITNIWSSIIYKEEVRR